METKSRKKRDFTITEIDDAIAEVKRRIKNSIKIDEVEDRLDGDNVNPKKYQRISKLMSKIVIIRLAEFRRILLENKQNAKRR